jgi:AcrR family transcriptional regulator
VSKPLWSGNRPKTDDEARARLCEAALESARCIGFEKTTMSDIAKMAGVARPTLYKYFKSKDEVLFVAIDIYAAAFTEEIVGYAARFSTYEERVVEMILYVVTELPRHRYLSLILDEQCATPLRERAFLDEATLVFSRMAAASLIELRPDLADAVIEIVEMMSRFATSIILFPSRSATDEEGLRQLIARRVLPGLK